MNRTEFISLLHKAFEENNLSNLISSETDEKLYLFADLLVETNKITNLTAITDDKGIILKHFVDCASISEYIDQRSKLIDVGCGAGFPSIPLAIIRPDLSITALDSTGKKIDFVKSVALKLSLTNLTAVCARAEDFASNNRESFDISTSRAVARLNILAEISLPLVKTGGKFVAMKSNKGAEELAEASGGIKKLGAELNLSTEKIFSFDGESINREFYVFSKTRPTPKEFPRKYAQILKRPL